jgi:hypothetical protein
VKDNVSHHPFKAPEVVTSVGPSNASQRCFTKEKLSSLSTNRPASDNHFKHVDSSGSAKRSYTGRSFTHARSAYRKRLTGELNAF